MSPAAQSLDLTPASKVLAAALGDIRELNGKTIPPSDGADQNAVRDRNAVVIPLRAELLRLAHEIDKARAFVMDAYHYQLREQRK